MCANLLPSSHGHEVTVERAIMLWGILMEEYIDVGRVLNTSMLRFMKGSTTAAIPHASIVVKLCAAVGVRWGDLEQLQLPSAPIDHSTISRMAEWRGARTDPKGLGYDFDDIEGGDQSLPLLMRVCLECRRTLVRVWGRHSLGG